METHGDTATATKLVLNYVEIKVGETRGIVIAATAPETGSRCSVTVWDDKHPGGEWPHREIGDESRWSCDEVAHWALRTVGMPEPLQQSDVDMLAKMIAAASDEGWLQ